MMLAHRMGSAATSCSSVGALITGFTVLSVLPGRADVSVRAVPDGAARARALLRRSFARVFAGVIAPFLMASYTGSPAIFFGTMVGVVAVGAWIPLMFGRETLGNLEAFTEAIPELA